VKKLQQLYTFEAEKMDGTIFSSDTEKENPTEGSLKDVVRLSFIPMIGINFPRHNFAGLPFQRRFYRYFKRSVVGGFDKEKFWAEVEKNMTESRKLSRKARDNKGLQPKIPEKKEEEKPVKTDECFSVVVCTGFRIYLRHLDGSILLTPEDYELYI